MGHTYSREAVQEFIEDYWNEWGVLLSYEDALLMLNVSDFLFVLLAKHEGEADDDSPIA